MNEKKISAAKIDSYQCPDCKYIEELLQNERENSRIKIVVLDDDPTGVQTVHDVSVYTDWEVTSIRAGFGEKSNLFFILTNSRGMTESETTRVHKQIGENVAFVSEELKVPYIIINRSDSTLRGHFPLETEIIRQSIEADGTVVDGEILCPYFYEGGRFTIDDVHYVKYGEELLPAGTTEFARDETFGYISSNLKEYVEEKTKGCYKASDCISISIEQLRNIDIDGITRLLASVHDYNKIIVNAVNDIDVKVFAIALYRALALGKHYTFRSAAALVKAMGNISDKPLLTKQELIGSNCVNGGIIAVGSHTKKTTDQLNELKNIQKIRFLEMDSDKVLIDGGLDKEVERLLTIEEECIANGITVCVSTKRALLKIEGDTPDEALKRSVRISDALQRCVGELKVAPSFVVAKGGITSSDIGIKALKVKKAIVLGQIQPGIPVWKTMEESKFPGKPYVIFPGNVGDIDTLRKVVDTFM